MIPSLLLIDNLESLKINDYKLGFIWLVSLEFIDKRKMALFANFFDEVLIPTEFKRLNKGGDRLGRIELGDEFLLFEWNLESHVVQAKDVVSDVPISQHLLGQEFPNGSLFLPDRDFQPLEASRGCQDLLQGKSRFALRVLLLELDAEFLDVQEVVQTVGLFKSFRIGEIILQLKDSCICNILDRYQAIYGLKTELHLLEF